MSREAFVYKWVDHGRDMYYIGSHREKKNDDYICSSDYMLVEYDKHPEDFTRQILVIGEEEYIRDLEEKYLTSLDAAHDPKSYNRHNGSGCPYTENHSEETKRKIGEANKGRTPWNKGIPMSEEAKHNLSLINKGRISSEESKNKLSKAIIGNKNALGNKHSIVTIEKLKKTWDIKIKNGYKLNEDARKKISEAGKGNKNGLGNKSWLGRKHSIEAIEKLKKINRL